MTHDILTRKKLRSRGRRAYLTGRSRDSHGMAASNPELADWHYGYDKAAAKNGNAIMAPVGVAARDATVIKSARIRKIVELCEVQPYNSRELCEKLKVTEACLRGYLMRLLEDGELVKWRSPVSLAKGRPNTYYAITPEQFDGFEDAPVRPVNKTWDEKPPSMFEPMAYLFGRAA